MSNPFAIFRKNQNYWMAGLVLLAILAFVVAPAIEQVQQALRTSGGGNAVAVRWNGGRMTTADLQNAMQKHGSLVRFLSALAREVIDEGGEPKVPNFFYEPQSKQIMRLGIQANTDEESIVRTRILADKAKQLGIEFSDDAVDEFILAYADGRVATSRIAEILREAGGGQLSNFDVRELLKKELAALVIQRTASTGVYSTAPGETYQDFLKLNRAAKIEAFPVFVADHLDKVKGSPTETEIQAIYDLGSMQFANPNSPDPGFVQPYQANFEYLEANVQQWTDREKAKLTEEQLRAEYDRLVKLEQLKVPVAQVPAETADPAAAGDDEPGLDLEPPATPAEGDQSSRSRASQIRFVSAPQDEAGLPPAVEQPPELDIDAPPQAAGEAASQAASEPADTPAGVAAAAPAMRTQTFDEAREQIASSLASAVAIPALEAAMSNILDKEMRPYFAAYRQYAAFRDAKLEGQVQGEEIEEPRRPDLKKLAEQVGLTYGQTGMTDGFKLVQTQFGKSNLQRDELGLSGSVANAAMNAQLPLFQTLQTNYFDQDLLRQGRMPDFFQYLAWKSDERPVSVPELSAVRGEVVDYWKRLQARKLAETAAATLAKKVSPTDNSPWKDALSTTEQSLLVETDPFTWITRMGDYNMTTNVNKLEPVGADFMRNVFAAQPGSSVVAPSENKSIYYVARVASFSPDESELQQRFSADPDRRGPMSLAQEESNQLVQDWYANLYDEFGVQFEIPLNQR